jgi:biotin operon repressor
MARPSKIDKLPPDIKGQINRLRSDGAEIDDIVAYLAEATPEKISRSAVGRHVKKLGEITNRINEARAIAEGVAPTLANKDDGQLLNLNVELLHSATMRLLSATDDETGEDIPIKASEAMALGKALEASAKAQKITADRVMKIKEAVAKTAIAEVSKEMKKAGQPGLSDELADDIFRRVTKGS